MLSPPGSLSTTPSLLPYISTTWISCQIRFCGIDASARAAVRTPDAAVWFQRAADGDLAPMTTIVVARSASTTAPLMPAKAIPLRAERSLFNVNPPYLCSMPRPWWTQRDARTANSGAEGLRAGLFGLPGLPDHAGVLGTRLLVGVVLRGINRGRKIGVRQ